MQDYQYSHTGIYAIDSDLRSRTFLCFVFFLNSNFLPLLPQSLALLRFCWGSETNICDILFSHIAAGTGCELIRPKAENPAAIDLHKFITKVRHYMCTALCTMPQNNLFFCFSALMLAFKEIVWTELISLIPLQLPLESIRPAPPFWAELINAMPFQWSTWKGRKVCCAVLVSFKLFHIYSFVWGKMASFFKGIPSTINN